MTTEPAPVQGLRGVAVALALLAAGGLLIHLTWHPPGLPGAPENPANWIPLVFGVTGVAMVPLLILSGRAWLAGYLINGFGVIVGTVTMAWHSISSWHGVPGPADLLLHSNLPMILLLLPKVVIGQRVLYHYRPRGAGRMFTGAWWLRHFIYLAAVFAAGVLLRRLGS